jgi:hypothetical protein
MIKSVVFLVCNLYLKHKKISLMYSLLNVGRLYLVLGFISILVYLNIPEEMNESTMAVWILGLSSIYFVLGIRRLIKHYKQNNQLQQPGKQ